MKKETTKTKKSVKREVAHYSWEYHGWYGEIIRYHDGYTVFLQGDDAAMFDEEWEKCKGRAKLENYYASQYEDFFEKPR